MDVHAPIHPPEPYFSMFPRSAERFDPTWGFGEFRELVRRGEPVPPEALEYIAATYDGAMAYADHHVGRVLGRLRELGLHDAAAIAVASDHGEGFGDNDVFGHGSSVRHAVTRVPLILKLPGQREGRRVATPVSTADLFPTFLEVAGLSVPDGIDAVSLRASAPPPERPLLAESYTETGVRARAVRVGDYKLVVRSGRNLQLFDVARDPGETIDLAARDAERASALRARLDGVGADLESAPRPEAKRLGEEHRARLRALGYVDDD